MLLYQVVSNKLLVRSRKLIGGFSRAKMVLSYRVANFGKIAPGRPQPNFEPLAVFQWFGRLESTYFFELTFEKCVLWSPSETSRVEKLESQKFATLV
jgi:hypothetical protein